MTASAARRPTVRLAVGGKPALFYLPLTVTERLGYFKDEGLDVEISDFPGGARALQALIGGSADVVTGAFDHTIQMQAKGQPIVAVVAARPLSGLRAGRAGAEGRRISQPRRSQGHEDRHHRAGLQHAFHGALPHGAGTASRTDDAAFIGIGAGPTAVAAVQRGEIDALVNVDPVISLLETDSSIKVVADTRTVEGTRAGLRRRLSGGGALCHAGLHPEQPQTVQSLVERVRARLALDRDAIPPKRSPP